MRTQWLFTTPNTSYIPFFTSTVIKLRPLCNGKYGLDDYSLHPQLFFTEYPWVPCIARRPRDQDRLEKHRLFQLWSDQPLNDWELLPVHAFHARGVMKGHLWEDLARTIKEIDVVAESLSRLQPPPTFATTRTAMFASLQRLRHLPMTKKDFVLQKAQCQRLAFDVDAMCTFLQRFHTRDTTLRAHVDEELMGCFTTNPAVVDKMYHRGIPVWFVRRPRDVPPGTMKVVCIVQRNEQAPGIQEWDYQDSTLPVLERVTDPFETVAHVGHEVQRITLLRTMGRQFADLVRLPTGPPMVLSEDQQDLMDPTNHYASDFPVSSSTPMRLQTPSPSPSAALSALSPQAYSFQDYPDYPCSAPTPIPYRSPSPLGSRGSSPAPLQATRHLPQGITKKKPKPRRRVQQSK